MKVKDILSGRTEWLTPGHIREEVPIVSVLLPTWKRAKSGLFEAAVKSVLAQTLENIELIIVDDCSTDGTFDIIKKTMEQDNRVSCIRHTENIGLPAISEFEAYQKARGTYIAFIFDDNEWIPDALENLVEYAKSNNIKAVAGQYKLFNGKPGASYDDPGNWSILGGKKVNISNLLITNCFGNGSVLLHRDTIESVGFLDPNIALSRLWDWDLWQRIAEKFQFDMVDIMVGMEKGCGLDDSLGNTHQLYQWGAQERMHQPRNQELLPCNYLECDIFDFVLPASPFLYRSNCWIAKQYEKKPWFDAQDSSLISIQKRSGQPWHGKRIAYLTASVDVNASATLNWGRLGYSPEYVLFYSCLYWFDYYNWVLADAIVIERDLSDSVDQILQWAKAMGIPCYYYIDDNFHVLRNDYRNTYLSDTMKRLSEGTSPDHLEKFKGVICSTNELQRYFLENGFHQKVSLIDLVFEENYVQPYHKMTDPINIVFFGSWIRGEILVRTLLPAISKIAAERNIRLYCPSDTFGGIANLFEKGYADFKKPQEPEDTGLEELEYSDGLTIVKYGRTLSLEMALKRLEKENIQIQIHCGPLIDNNQYKTVNALLNAVCLGSVLIATNDHPYSDLDNDNAVCLLADNTEESWETALRKAIDPQLHDAIYQNALAYCKAEFSREKSQKLILEAMAGVCTYDFLDLNKRLIAYAKYLQDILGMVTSVNGCQGLSTMAVSPVIVNNNSVSIPMYLSTLNRSCLKKVIRATAPEWSEKGRIESLLSLGLSAPIMEGKYLETRTYAGKRIGVVLASNITCLVLFEFISQDKIIGQIFRTVNGLQYVVIDVPESRTPVRMRIAQRTEGGLLFAIERRFITKRMVDTMVLEKE